MVDDVQKQLDDLEYVPRTYEQAVAERAQRRRDALVSRRQQALEPQEDITPQQAIVDNVTRREGGRLHGDHLDYTNKASGAFYRNQKGAKQHSGAYFRRNR